MRIEDVRSDSLRNGDFNDLDFSDIRESLGDFNRKSDFETREINIKDLYKLDKHVRNIINQVEAGERYNGVLKFAGVTFNLQIFGLEISKKSKLAMPETTENLQEKVNELQNTIIELRKKISIPDQAVNRFCGEIEKKMLDSYQESYTNMWTPSEIEINPLENPSGKSWALMEFDYKVLKNHHKKCEEVSNNLQWQGIEVQLIRSQLQKKLQITNEKEGYLIAKHQELAKTQKEYDENLHSVESERKTVENEIQRVEKYKRKLEKMKKILKTQIEALKTGGNRPSSASRVSETSPSLRRFRSNNSNNESLDSEIEEVQLEIHSVESSLQDSVNETGSVKLCHLYTQLSNLRTQRVIEKNSLTSESMQVSLTKSMEKLPFPRKFTFSSAENSPNSTPIKIPTASPRENLSDVSKPPIYRRNNRGQTETVTTPTSNNTKITSIREERVAEREIEVERREKELQATWMKMPHAQELIPMVQNQVIALKKAQVEYDKKLKLLQNQIIRYDNLSEKIKEDGKDKGKGEGSEIYINRLKDLYMLMEELLL